MASHPCHLASPRKKSKVRSSKRHLEDDAGGSQLKKGKRGKNHSSQVANGDALGDVRRSKRAGAGSGGWTSQMERIGAVLEKRPELPQRVSDAAGDLPENPLAPPQKKRRGKAQPSNPPPPYLPAPQVDRSTDHNSQSDPLFHSSQHLRDPRFGFVAGVPVILPGMEPDLQSVNNPYVAAARSRQVTESSASLALPSQSTGPNTVVPIDTGRPLQVAYTPVSSAPPSRGTVPNQSDIPIDPVILQASYSASQNPSKIPPARGAYLKTHEASDRESSTSTEDSSGGEQGSSDGDSDGDLDDMPDVGWATTGKARVAHPGFSSENTSVVPPRHHSLPPDHEFTFSRDEDDQTALNTLQTNAAHLHGMPEDVLECHHQNNGYPSAPNQDQLSSLARLSQTDTAPKIRAPRNSKKPKDASPSADCLSYYPPTWRDCLEDAKRECRAAHSLTNLFPSSARDLDGTVAESLTTVVIEWQGRGVAFEPGYWPDKKKKMASMLLGDMSTWRCELKKVAIACALTAFKLGPPDDVPLQQRAGWVEEAAAKLLDRSMFLRNGLDGNGRTNNFAHPSLKQVAVDFFYTGTYRVADKRPNQFRNTLPLTCLALVGAAYNCVLDGFARNGNGKSFPNFSAKSYNSVFLTMLGMLQDIQKDPYHGAKLDQQLTEWAKEGWDALKGVDTAVERHSHLQIALD